MHEDSSFSDEKSGREEQKTPPSIREVPPLETGGSEARRGFELQDHVAARYCIRMLTEAALKEVWCENQDDITLIWTDGSSERAEFVQVKSNQLDGLWTIAKLCERETAISEPTNPSQKGPSKKSKRQGTSILERSLAYDRCNESPCFRIVSSWPVNKDLQILTYSGEYRAAATEELAVLVVALRKYVDDFVSPNRRDCSFWASQTTWEVVGSTDSVRNQNLLFLSQYLALQGEFVAPDQLEEIYMRLVAKVNLASLADWRIDLAAKRIPRGPLAEWFRAAVQAMIRPGSKGGVKLQAKMKTAMLPNDSIETALEERARYREEMLAQRYFTSVEYGAIEGEIMSVLHSLRAQLDSGTLDDKGIAFHARCRQQLEIFRQGLPESKRPHLFFVHGCMYNITDRCTHRFIRATP